MSTQIDIRYGDVLVGWLEVGSRLPGEPLMSGEYQLLKHLARQVGITLHAAPAPAASSSRSPALR
ncbi:MAG: hypothetical protein U0Z44_13075 [Kouleothrix sp.]